jgi:hypothetical protein
MGRRNTNTGSAAANKTGALLKESQALAKSLGLEYENIADLQDMILKGQIRSSDELLRQLQLARQAETYIRDQVALEEHTAKLLKEQKELKKDIKDLSAELTKPLRKVATLTEDIYEQDLARIQKAKELNAITEQEADAYKQQLDTLNKLSKNPVVKAGFTAAADSLDSMQKSIDGFMSSLPGGEMISKAFGLDKLSEKLQNAILSGGKLGIVGLVAAVGILYKVLSDVTKEAEAFSKETGVTFGQARQIADAAREAQSSYGNQLALQKDILDVQQETIKAFGTTAMLTGEQAANVADLGKSFGYGAQQAAQVNNAFMTMGATAGDAYEAQQSLAAEALKAGVNVGAVTKDIAENAKNTAQYFGGNVTALKNAAIEAAKMGMSIATMAKISDKLLDIQSSVAAQFEFQALSGRQLDLDLARQLALEGDIAGAAKEVLSAVGSSAEFNKMSVLEKKKLAEATGMEVDELQKSLLIQEKLGDLTDDQKAAMSGLNLSAQQLKEMGPEQIRQRLAEQQALEKNAALFESIKNELVTALVPIAQILGTVLSGIATTLKIAFMPITWAVDAMSYLLDLMYEYSWITASILTVMTLITIQKNQQAVLDAAAAIRQGAILAYQQGRAIVEGLITGELIAQGIATVRNMAKSAIEGAMVLGKAIAKIFGTFAQIPFGVGIPLAIAAVGGLMSLFKGAISSTGDLAMGANNGPIVTNPREGTIFQGTKNDEVAMGPGVIGAAQGGGSATVVQQSGGTDPALINGLMMKLDELIQAAKTPPAIQIGSQTIKEISNQQASSNSFRQNYNGV